MRFLFEYSFPDVRFAPDSDHGADMPACLKCANTGLIHSQTGVGVADHLVRRIENGSTGPYSISERMPQRRLA
jgi:hypothetical protein